MENVEIPGRSQGRELAIVQRIRDRPRNVTVLICAGLGLSATYGAARYLVQHWGRLHAQFGEHDFDLCLAFPHQLPDSEEVTDPILVEVRPYTIMASPLAIPPSQPDDAYAPPQREAVR